MKKKKVTKNKKAGNYFGGPPNLSDPVEKDDQQIILPEVHNDRSYIGYNSGDNFSFGEEREFKTNPVASKYAFDLFKEEDASPNTIIRVKHVRSTNKNEKWKVFENNKNVFTLDGAKISKKERQFLHSVEGVQFLLAQSKLGSLTVNGLKKEMRARITQLSGKAK